jgi:ABC-type phosphate transport system substrate-binding protein
MKKAKFFLAALTLAAAMLLASNCYAQSNLAPLWNVAGSSGAFNAFALAGEINSGPCGTNNWTKKSGTATAVDNRSSQISAAGGNVWIEWNNTPEPNRVVCAYIAVDSGVGQRLFFASPQGSLSIPSSAVGENGDNIVPLLPADTPLPQNIFNDLNNQVFNAAPTDVRAEDAEFATTRALAALNPQNYNGLGYGPGPIGTEVLSAFSGKTSQPVAFNLSGNDPITGQKVVKATEFDAGAQVVMVIVNSTDTGPGGLGNAALFTNVDRFVLGGVQAGLLTRTRDLVPSSGLPVVPLHVLTREPTSGTYNVMEFCIPRNTEVSPYAISQENGVNPANDNPMNFSSADGATRQRVIGTGEMQTELENISDSIGYFFWSFSNAAPLVTLGRYLTVDGVDPIFANYTGGTLPTCTAPCPGAVPFTHVLDGSYPIWNVLRVTTYNPEPSGVAAMIAAVQTQFTQVPDVVPFSQLEVFRSHYTQSGIAPHNGHLGRGAIESGGDMGGAVLTVQADLDTITDTGKEILNKKQ